MPLLIKEIFELKMEKQICIEGRGIPFNQVLEASRIIPYASDVSVMFKMLFLTGCRITELNSMKKSKLIGNVVYWPLGKNQRTWRKEILPDFYIKELMEYRATHRVYQDRLFGISHFTFKRYFNRDIRPLLPPEWHKKDLRINGKMCKWEYKYNLRGMRKSYQTLIFKQELDKWKDSHVAVLFTSKRMRHSSTHITAYHYLCNFDELKIAELKHLSPAKILAQTLAQTRISDFIT